MSTAEIDLRTLLEQDHTIVMDLLDNSQKLVLETEALHYWTLLSLETFASLHNISGNLLKLIEALGPYWGEGKAVLAREEAMKLWKTATGLWRALPPVRNRFVEELNRRRRQRIMRQKLDEEDVDPAVWKEELERFKAEQDSLRVTMRKFVEAINLIPAGLVLEGAASGSPAAAAQPSKPVAAPDSPPPATPIN